MSYTVTAHDFGVDSFASNNSRAFGRAMRALQGRDNATLIIPPGRYRVDPLYADEIMPWISNHDNGFTRRVALRVENQRDLTIHAQGVELLCNGHILPLFILNSSNVTVEGLTIDWAHPLHGWGEVVNAWNGWIDVKITSGHPWRVVRERLMFLVGGALEEVGGIFEVDPGTFCPTFGSGDNCGGAWTVPWVAEDLGDGVVRFRNTTTNPPKPGQILILRHGLRVAPAVAAIGVENLTLRDVSIHAASGMGVLCQRCTDPVLERVSVTPSQGRPFSTNADGLHFADCRGHVKIEQCVTSHHLDDAVNAHGNYLQIVERQGRQVLLRLVDVQQRGNMIAMPGEQLAFVDGNTLQQLAVANIVSCVQLSAEYTEVIVDIDPPKAENLIVENLTWRCDLTVRKCSFRHHRARGILVKNGKRAVIEDNLLESSGAAILVGILGAVGYWESGVTADIVIRGNRFVRCGMGGVPPWGRGVIDVDPKPRDTVQPLGSRLTVENNTVEDCLSPLVEASCGVAELIVRNNRGDNTVNHKHCGRVEIN